jgi:hypothetical protein
MSFFIILHKGTAVVNDLLDTRSRLIRVDSEIITERAA